MAFLDDPSNQLFENKIPGADIGTRDPRTVPRAVDFNQLKGAALELRSEVLDHRQRFQAAATMVDLLQAIAFSSPPDPALYPFWLDTSGSLTLNNLQNLASAIVQATRTAAVGGAGAYVVLPGSPDVSIAAGAIVKAARSGDAAATALIAVAGQVVASGGAYVAMPSPQVTAQGAAVVQASPLAQFGGAAYVDAAAGPPSLGLPNGDFEAAIGSVEGDNWWPMSGGTYPGSGTRSSSTPLVGSWSGLCNAGPGGYDEPGEGWYTGSGWGGLKHRTTKTALDTAGHLKFQMKPTNAVSGGVYAAIRTTVYNASSIVISATAGNVNIAMLWGLNASGTPRTTEKIAAPVTGTTYNVDYDLLGHAQAIMLGGAGQTWADASKIIVEIHVGTTGNAQGEYAEMIIDNFVEQ